MNVSQKKEIAKLLAMPEIRVSLFLNIFITVFSLCIFRNLEGTLEQEVYWRILFRDYGMGYTLFGDKPMTFDRYYYANADHILEPKGKSIAAFWEEQPPISNKHFCLKKVRYYQNDEQFEEFFLINKPACLGVIQQYLDEFQEEFPACMSGEEILDSICECGPHCITNHRLLGLLLGFGDHNTYLFQRRYDLESDLERQIPFQDPSLISTLSFAERINYCCGRKLALTPSAISWNAILKEIRELDQRLKPFNNLIAYENLLPFPLPSFVVDPYNQETKNLLEHYLEENKRIASIYYAPDFLKHITKALIKLDPVE